LAVSLSAMKKGQSPVSEIGPFGFQLVVGVSELVTSAAAAAASAAVVTAASTTAAAAGTALLRLEAVAAEDRTIASRFKRNRSLLAAARTNYRGSRGCA
jgi:CHAT domain-containing protein